MFVDASKEFIGCKKETPEKNLSRVSR